MIRRRIAYCAVLLALALLQIFSDHYLAFFALTLAVILPALSFCLSLPAMLACRISAAPQSAAAGRGTATRWLLTVDNRRRLPLARITLRLKLCNRMTGKRSFERLRLSGASRPRRLVIPADTSHCGLLECSVTQIRVCDCLGLFSLRRPTPPPALMPVLPLLDAEGKIPEEPERGRQGGAVLPAGRGGGTGEEYELRPYRPGDPVRLIHWKLSSKRDELVFREMMETRQTIPLLLFDHFGTPDEMDRILDRLYTVSHSLLERQRLHRIQWRHPLTGILREHQISGGRDLERCMAAALEDPAPLAGKSIFEEETLPRKTAGDWIIRIGREKEA